MRARLRFSMIGLEDLKEEEKKRSLDRFRRNIKQLNTSLKSSFNLPFCSQSQPGVSRAWSRHLQGWQPQRTEMLSLKYRLASSI